MPCIDCLDLMAQGRNDFLDLVMARIIFWFGKFLMLFLEKGAPVQPFLGLEEGVHGKKAVLAPGHPKPCGILQEHLPEVLHAAQEPLGCDPLVASGMVSQSVLCFLNEGKDLLQQVARRLDEISDHMVGSLLFPMACSWPESLHWEIG